MKQATNEGINLDRSGSDVWQNVVHFLLILLFEICLYQLFLIKHYGLDSYCMLYNPMEYATASSRAGRPLTVLIASLLNFLQINIIEQQLFFTAAAIIILSLSVFMLTKTALSLRKEGSLYHKVFLTLTSILIFNNIFSVEMFLFSYFTVLYSLAMLIIVFSIRLLVSNSSKNIIVLYLLAIVSIGSMYQGYGGLFVPLTSIFLLYINKNSLKTFFIQTLLVSLVYLISLLPGALWLKYGHFLFYSFPPRIASIHFSTLSENIINIFKKQPDIWITHLNMFPKYFFILFFLASIILFLTARKDPSFKKISILSLLAAILLSSFFLSFVPHLFSSPTWVPPRTIMGISALPGLIFFALVLMTPIHHSSSKENVLTGGAIVISVVILFIFTNRIASDHLQTNRMDNEYAKSIAQEIALKEKKSGVPVSKLAFIMDKYPRNYYEGMICSGDGVNISARNAAWDFPFLLQMVSGRSFQVVEMDPSIYETFFKDKNWDSFDKDQVIVKNDTVYVTTY